MRAHADEKYPDIDPLASPVKMRAHADKKHPAADEVPAADEAPAADDTPNATVDGVRKPLDNLEVLNDG